MLFRLVDKLIKLLRKLSNGIFVNKRKKHSILSYVALIVTFPKMENVALIKKRRKYIVFVNGKEALGKGGTHTLEKGLVMLLLCNPRVL